MKIKTQERLATCSMLLMFLGPIVSKGLLNLDQTEMKLMNEAFALPFQLNLISSGYVTSNTDEYKNIEKEYEKVLDRTVSLIKDLNLKDPVEIFSLFIHLYRSGLCSYNHKFEYDTDMKDLPNLLGVDVVRGTGVCRSIASFLTDIYKKMGYDSCILTVGASNSSIKNLTKHSKLKLHKSEKGSKMAKIIGGFTSLFHLPNHAVTYVSDKDKYWVLDPTNDGILFMNKLNTRLEIPNNRKSYMRNYRIIALLYQLLKILGSPSDYKNLINNRSKETISMEEYNKKYLNTQDVIDQNNDKLNQYYEDNIKLYDSIFWLMSNQKNLINRTIFPFVDLKDFNIKYIERLEKIDKKIEAIKKHH